MIKALNLKLFRSILDLDISILSRKNLNKRRENTLYEILSPVELHQSLKQFIKLIYFLNRRQKLTIYLLTKNTTVTDLFQFLIDTHFSKFNIKLDSMLPKISESKKSCTFLVFLSDFNVSPKSLHMYINLNHVFMISKINSSVEKFFFGNYKIFNDLQDFKKVIFLLILISKALIK